MINIRFQPYTNYIDPSFWFTVTEKKQKEWHLNEPWIHIYGVATGNREGGRMLPSAITIPLQSISKMVSDDHLDVLNEISQHQIDMSGLYIRGYFHNTNTLDAFHQLDPWPYLQDIADDIWKFGICPQPFQWTSKRSTFLNSILLISFADIKRYKYTFIIAHPCWTNIKLSPYSCKQMSLFSKDADTKMIIKCKPDDCLDYFIARSTHQPSLWTYHSMNDCISIDNDYDSIYFCFFDPGTTLKALGWTARNFLVALHASIPGKTVNLLGIRQAEKHNDEDVSFITINDAIIVKGLKFPDNIPKKEDFESTGWLCDAKGNIEEKIVRLESMMNPLHITQNALSLNLDLMKWRMVPNLNLKLIQSTKCLLLGSGTLGCNVARCLLGWGIYDITLVDNGVVSHSNPARQSLFIFEDISKSKAIQSAKRLESIFPNVNAKGIDMDIPMPGHLMTMNDTIANIEKLSRLIYEHDVVFLLTDTRESRWLPTLLAKIAGKLAITIGLGFDSFIVMRHGTIDNGLGCYFCQDFMIGPSNTVRNRSLDQQCTISRPGLSMIASALGTELMISTLVHPNGINAPAEISQDFNANLTTDLGIVPHQIRGTLSHYHQVLGIVDASSYCNACSDSIQNSYKEYGIEFLVNTMQNPSTLKKLVEIITKDIDTVSLESI